MANLEESLGKDICHISDLLKSSTGGLQSQIGLDNVQNALFHRLMTSPGSLIHRPTYGVGIKDYQNAPASLSIYRRLAQKIGEQFALDPRVNQVLGVSLDADDATPSRVVLTVRVDIMGYGETAIQYTPFSEGA